jgi:pentatricopeptide repeat protein
LADTDNIEASLRSTDSSNPAKPLDGKASNGLTFVFNSALSELASKGDLKHFLSAFSSMQKSEVRANRETTTHLINALGRGGQLPAVTLLLKALADRDTSVLARQQLFDTLKIATTSLTPLEASHYAAAIGACLEENNIEHAHQILSMMQENSLTPTPECLQKFALAYAERQRVSGG